MNNQIFRIFFVILISVTCTISNTQQKPKLPQGPGLAAKYPGDIKIETHKTVLFADSFASGNFKKWGEDQTGGDTTRAKVTTDPKLAYHGKHACQMTATRGKNNGGGLIKWLDKGHDEIYARFYVKFAKDAGYTHHFVHLNGSTKRWGSFGKAGLKPNGKDFFTTGIEPWFDWGKNPPPGKWIFYTYWPDMQGSRNGKYWGNHFQPDSGNIPRDKWICIEVRVKMNTPGKKDGEQTVWQDGKITGHFTGFNWRTTEKLKTNIFWLMHYVTEKAFTHTDQHAPKHKSKANTKTNTVWFDQIVVATQYIGPLQKKPNQAKTTKPSPQPVLKIR